MSTNKGPSEQKLLARKDNYERNLDQNRWTVVTDFINEVKDK